MNPVIKYTVTLTDASTHDFLTMDDMIAFSVAQNGPAAPVAAPAGPTEVEVQAAADTAIEDTFTPPADAPAPEVPAAPTV